MQVVPTETIRGDSSVSAASDSSKGAPSEVEGGDGANTAPADTRQTFSRQSSWGLAAMFKGSESQVQSPPPPTPQGTETTTSPIVMEDHQSQSQGQDRGQSQSLGSQHTMANPSRTPNFGGTAAAASLESV